MRQVVLFIAASLDGYIARADDSVSWLDEVESDGDGGFAAFYETIDTVVMGRKTYDIVCGLVGQYPHRDRTSYIFSRNEQLHRTEPASESECALQICADEIGAWLHQLKQQSGKHIWLVGGGELIAQCLLADCVDQIILTIAPLHLGTGVPLHLPLAAERHWRLLDVRQVGQFAQLTYSRKMEVAP
jgi:dihydrofolate reductase